MHLFMLFVWLSDCIGCWSVCFFPPGEISVSEFIEQLLVSQRTICQLAQTGPAIWLRHKCASFSVYHKTILIFSVFYITLESKNLMDRPGFFFRIYCCVPGKRGLHI